MIGLVAFDLVLRVVRAGVMAVALIGHIFGVHPHYPACDPACFGIPAHVIADLEYSRHDASASPAPERNVNSAAPQAAFVRGTLTAGWERILEVHQVENGPANGERQYGR